jgi:two-component system OmpR family sensor kinase
MSLRARLIVILAALLAVGLVVSGGLTYGALKSFLYKRLDQQLQQSQPYAIRALAGSLRGIPPPSDENLSLPISAYAELRAPDGDIVQRIIFGSQNRAGGAYIPQVPASLHAGANARAFTVGATDNSSFKFRVLATPLADGGMLVVAIPIQDVQQTLHRLLLIEVVVAAVLLGATTAAAWMLVRRELRSLERISQAAAEIAAGDLTRRIDTVDERTEVGTLSEALNRMLEHIEQAFEARRASEDRMRRFLADASHELRTPLTSIRGYAELFRRGADQRPDDLRAAMRRIEDEAQRMGVLVEDLLLLAHVDRVHPLDSTRVDLRAIASDSADDARARAPDRSITVIGAESLPITGDGDRLRQAVNNLVNNAIVHTPSGTPVEVAVGADGDSATITVTDWGPGLDEQALAHAFDRFWRGDPSRSRSSGGVGLGLAIVDAIARAHGGEVAVENLTNAGARFSLRIPRAEAPAVLNPSP